jgi:hypothetical protein
MRTLFLATAVLAVMTSASAQTPDCGVVRGFEQRGPAREFGPDNLFEYMDGNAEGYLVYNFVKMNGVTCQNGEDTIVIDVFEMADPEYAFGIFSANRDPRLQIDAIGMGAQITQRRALFAKDRYYVEFAANPIKDHSANLQAFASAFEKKIPGRGTPPDPISWFPKDKLTPNSVRLVPESVLGLRMLRRGYVGQYDFGKAFLVIEDSPDSARQVMIKLKERIGLTSPGRVGEESFTANDKYLDGLYVFRVGRYIGGFANLKGGHDASAESAALAASVK